MTIVLNSEFCSGEYLDDSQELTAFLFRVSDTV